MPRPASFVLLALILFLGGYALVRTLTDGPPAARYHAVTQARPVTVLPATLDPGPASFSILVRDGLRQITGTGIPQHLVGPFPNDGNPNAIEPVEIVLQTTASPAAAARVTPLGFGWVFGVSITGTTFDPIAAEWWHGDRESGWQYEAMGGAIELGVDANHAHVQPTGEYHYHGLPTGLMSALGVGPDAPSPVIGWAADGFPIFALYAGIDGQSVPMTSSWRLKPGTRPGGDAPDGAHDGAFVQDYEHVAGSGTLDACNGAKTVTPDFPDGTYGYFLTAEFPVIPRCWTGTPDPSFAVNLPGTR